MTTGLPPPTGARPDGHPDRKSTSSASSRPRSRNFDATAETRNVGTVVEVGDGIAQVYGLAGALFVRAARVPRRRLLGRPSTSRRRPWAPVILGNATAIKEGDVVKTTGRVVEAPVGPELLGRVVDRLARAPARRQGAGQRGATSPACRTHTGRRGRIRDRHETECPGAGFEIETTG